MEEQKTLAQWVASLSEHQLPLLKQSFTNLNQIGSYESVSMAKFSNIALTDPGLTLGILRAASVMPRSRLQDEIHTVDTAAIKLGAVNIAKTIDTMKVLDDCLKNGTKTIYMQTIARAYHAAYQAYGMARERIDMAPEELFTAAMLSDIGALMLLVYGDGILSDSAILDDVAGQEKLLGFNLRQLSYELAKTWKLSNFILRSLEDKDENLSNPRLYEIHLASELAICADQSWETEEMQAIIEKIAAHLHCDPEMAMLEVRDNAIQCAEETTFYNVTPAASRLPDMEEDLLKRFSISDDPQVVQAAQRANSGPPAASLAPEQPFSPLNIAIYDKTIKAIKTHLSTEFNLAKFMTLLKRGFQDGLKLNRAFFAMPGQDNTYLISRFVFGNDAGLRNLHIPVTDRNLFQRMLETPQAIHCNENNRAKVIPLIPEEFQSLIKTDEFFVMTIRVKGKVKGIVYADRYGNNYGLDKNDYEKLCQLCQLLAKGFERL